METPDGGPLPKGQEQVGKEPSPEARPVASTRTQVRVGTGAARGGPAPLLSPGSLSLGWHGGQSVFPHLAWKVALGDRVPPPARGFSEDDRARRTPGGTDTYWPTGVLCLPYLPPVGTVWGPPSTRVSAPLTMWPGQSSGLKGHSEPCLPRPTAWRPDPRPSGGRADPAHPSPPQCRGHPGWRGGKGPEEGRAGSWTDVTAFAAAGMFLGHMEASLGSPVLLGCSHLCTRAHRGTHAHTGTWSCNSKPPHSVPAETPPSQAAVLSPWKLPALG